MEKIIMGIISGSVYAWMGYQKELKDRCDAAFDWKKLGINVLICALVGVYGEYTGLNLDLLMVAPVGIGVTKLFSLFLKLTKNP